MTLDFWKIIDVAAARVQQWVMKWSDSELGAGSVASRLCWRLLNHTLPLCTSVQMHEKSGRYLSCTASGNMATLCYLSFTFSWGHWYLMCFWNSHEKASNMKWAVWLLTVPLFHYWSQQPLDSVGSANGKAISKRARCCVSSHRMSGKAQSESELAFPSASFQWAEMSKDVGSAAIESPFHACVPPGGTLSLWRVRNLVHVERGWMP